MLKAPKSTVCKRQNQTKIVVYGFEYKSFGYPDICVCVTCFQTRLMTMLLIYFSDTFVSCPCNPYNDNYYFSIAHSHKTLNLSTEVPLFWDSDRWKLKFNQFLHLPPIIFCNWVKDIQGCSNYTVYQDPWTLNGNMNLRKQKTKLKSNGLTELH